MTPSDFSRFALIWAVVALLAGCGGSQPPIGAPGAMPQTSTLATQANHGKAWILPQAKHRALLYVSFYPENGDAAVQILTYPEGRRVGMLSGFATPYGSCADNRGNVFVTDWYRQEIVEYAHGGTSPIATLADSGYAPGYCSFDSTTRNLAVSNMSTASGGAGNIAIYANEQGTATLYSDPGVGDYWSCGYDNKGSLFLAGREYRSGDPTFAELPKGSSTFLTLSLPFPVDAGIQWDGEYVAVGSVINEENARIYRLDVSGSTVTVKGTVSLEHGEHKVNLIGFVWIGGRRLLASLPNSVAFWSYPEGGEMTRRLRYRSRGLTVSYPGKPE